MPEISEFCPACGRPVESVDGAETNVAGVSPLSRYAFLGAIAYVGVVPAIIFVLLPTLRKSSFVRFHSWQCLLLTVAVAVAGLATKLVFAIVSLAPFLGFLVAWISVGLVSLATVFLWIAIVVKAALGDAYELPVIGGWAAALANRE